MTVITRQRTADNARIALLRLVNAQCVVDDVVRQQESTVKIDGLGGVEPCNKSQLLALNGMCVLT